MATNTNNILILVFSSSIDKNDTFICLNYVHLFQHFYCLSCVGIPHLSFCPLIAIFPVVCPSTLRGKLRSFRSSTKVLFLHHESENARSLSCSYQKTTALCLSKLVRTVIHKLFDSFRQVFYTVRGLVIIFIQVSCKLFTELCLLGKKTLL